MVCFIHYLKWLKWFLFIRGPKKSCVKYRPISVVPTLSKFVILIDDLRDLLKIILVMNEIIRTLIGL